MNVRTLKGTPLIEALYFVALFASIASTFFLSLMRRLFALSTVLSNRRNIFVFDTADILTGNRKNPQKFGPVDLESVAEATGSAFEDTIVYASVRSNDAHRSIMSG